MLFIFVQPLTQKILKTQEFSRDFSQTITYLSALKVWDVGIAVSDCKHAFSQRKIWTFKPPGLG